MQLEQYMKDHGLNWSDFEIVDDSVPCKDETPREYVSRLTGQDIPSMKDMTWDDVRKVSTDALNRNVKNPFVEILMRCSRPHLILRQKA